MTHPLDGAWAKIKRAQLHIKSLDREINRYLKPHRLTRLHLEPEGQRVTKTLQRFRLRLDVAEPPARHAPSSASSGVEARLRPRPVARPWLGARSAPR